MKLIHPYTHEKAVFVERVHQTIQSIFWAHISHTGSKQIIDILDDVIHTYNNRAHRMLGNKTPQWAIIQIHLILQIITISIWTELTNTKENLNLRLVIE